MPGPTSHAHKFVIPAVPQVERDPLRLAIAHLKEQVGTATALPAVPSTRTPRSLRCGQHSVHDMLGSPRPLGRRVASLARQPAACCVLGSRGGAPWLELAPAQVGTSSWAGRVWRPIFRNPSWLPYCPPATTTTPTWQVPVGMPRVTPVASPAARSRTTRTMTCCGPPPWRSSPHSRSCCTCTRCTTNRCATSSRRGRHAAKRPAPRARARDAPYRARRIGTSLAGSPAACAAQQPCLRSRKLPRPVFDAPHLQPGLAAFPGTPPADPFPGLPCLPTCSPFPAVRRRLSRPLPPRRPGHLTHQRRLKGPAGGTGATGRAGEVGARCACCNAGRLHAADMFPP